MMPTRDRPPRRCEQCGRSISPDLGCRHCFNVLDFWHRAQREHPELSREHCILIGAFAAAMEEAYVHQHSRYGREFTQSEFEHAITMAGEYLKTKTRDGHTMLKDPDLATDHEE